MEQGFETLRNDTQEPLLHLMKRNKIALIALSRPGGDVFFHWETSRATACLDHVIPLSFTGIIQCDDFGVSIAL